MNTEKITELLKTVCLFSDLEEQALGSIAELCIPRRYGKGSVICNEGDTADTLFLIEQGQIKVYLSDEQGQELVLTTMEAGDYFGELGILTDQTRAASVMTTSDSLLYAIQKSGFDTLLDNNHKLTRTLLTNLASFSKSQVNTIKAFAMKDVYGRLVSFFEAQAIEEDGVLKIKPKMTQKLLASRVGATRERVARIMKDLSVGGYIKVDTDAILLLKKLPTSY